MKSLQEQLQTSHHQEGYWKQEMARKSKTATTLLIQKDEEIVIAHQKYQHLQHQYATLLATAAGSGNSNSNSSSGQKEEKIHYSEDDEDQFEQVQASAAAEAHSPEHTIIVSQQYHQQQQQHEPNNNNNSKENMQLQYYNREELTEQVKSLRHEINHLRNRLSITTTTNGFSGSKDDLVALHNHTNNANANNANATMMTMMMESNSANNALPKEQEQRLVYLKQAFVGFFKAKQSVEMQHLGRVICAILGVSIEDQTVIMEQILRLSPTVVANSTFESFSQQIVNIFL